MNVQSYNDADGFTNNPDAYDEAYMRGAYIFKDAAKTIPRDCQKFFLREGIMDGWDTLSANITRIENLDAYVGFRVTSAGHVPNSYKTFESGNWKYVDFRDSATRTSYQADLVDFANRFGSRLAWIDIPYPFCPSNEPGVAWQTLKDLGDGNEAAGKVAYIAAAKWLIDLYTELFPRKCIGNLGGPSWAAEILLPYALSKGVMGYRQDSFGRMTWNGNPQGEDRGSMYNQRIGYLGGRDKFYRLIFEITGNGIVNGKDQNTGDVYPETKMLGSTGEYVQLDATDFGNMGIAYSSLPQAAKAAELLDAFYEYTGADVPPVDPPIDPPIDPPDTELEERVSALEAAMDEVIAELDELTRRFAHHSHELSINTSGPGYTTLPLNG